MRYPHQEFEKQESKKDIRIYNYSQDLSKTNTPNVDSHKWNDL